MNNDFGIFVSAVIGAIAFLVFISFILSWPVYMLWNGCLVGAVDGVKEITWLQGWGINLLAGFFFRSSSSSSSK
jgi:hypothetical protein